MVGLDPNIQLIGHIRLSLSRGEALKTSLTQFCKENRGVITQQLASLLIAYQQNKENYCFLATASNERRLVMDIVWRGLRGESIFQNLPDLERELELRAHERLDSFIKTLPIKVLLVVMVFQFPALLILSLLPILDQLLEVMK